MHHDHCYEKAVESGACSSTIWEYINLYDWSCVNSTAVCAEKNTKCEAALCKCDVDVVKCWGQYPKPPKKLKCVKH
ncbi:hypothetical protein OESDEN_18336 [Oesophagostomum dentatum]|uniref:Phospholipase A2-like central domain-containing protein n=1 Tax=Oesophagostomum dentatum TaxID=61180 RepID=A0A0B1S9I9_OESDE|nr:hypothetical protein OESDEN_18336 [Oesophagostomum dentatum]